MILPPATLGVLGGGQLGRFFVQAAQELGYRVMVLDPDPKSPAGRIAEHHLVAAYDDPAALNRLAEACAAVSTEFENVPAAALQRLATDLVVRPSADCVAIAQDRAAEKAFLADRGFAVGPFATIGCEADLAQADPALFPGVLKVSRFGYDGKGQARVASPTEARMALHLFHGEPCVLERQLVLDREISCVVARGDDGDVQCFPIVENIHRDGILDVSIAPARISGALAAATEEMAAGLAAEMGYVGVMAVEYFVVGGELLVNEIAPRPHNSGHFTLDACVSSQFDQQVRTLCGLPLGSPRQHCPAVMVNLLGDLWRHGDPDWSRLYADPNLKLHLYGKDEARPGRKMGHFTVLASELREALDIALAARCNIGVEDEIG